MAILWLSITRAYKGIVMRRLSRRLQRSSIWLHSQLLAFHIMHLIRPHNKYNKSRPSTFKCFYLKKLPTIKHTFKFYIYNMFTLSLWITFLKVSKAHHFWAVQLGTNWRILYFYEFWIRAIILSHCLCVCSVFRKNLGHVSFFWKSFGQH